MMRRPASGWLRWVGLLGLLTALAGCMSPRSATPTPAFTVDYSRIAHATPRPVTPIPTITPGGATTVSFARDIQPLLAQHCVRCHRGIAGMWLTDYEHLSLGSINGPILRPGDPERSPLFTYVRDGLMPPDAPDLNQREVEQLRRWVAEGALPN